MRDWLLERGVPADDVLAEMDSRNTRQNLENAAALLAPETSVTVVTSDYHLPRALAMARDTGLDADGVGSPCRPEYWMKNHCRELLSWGKYLLEKAMGQKAFSCVSARKDGPSPALHYAAICAIITADHEGGFA